jgi:hydroxyacylglutathione hydrolase
MTLANSSSAKVQNWRYRAPGHGNILPIRAFNDNYIWLISLVNRAGEPRALVVDPGDAAPVLRTLQALHLNLAGILITHHHADHTGGIGDLKAAFPDAVVYGPRKCANPFISRRFDHGDTLTIADLDFSCGVIEVPGHTLDHNAYFCERVGNDERPVLFCGDTLFAGGCGRIFEGTPALMQESLARLAELPPATLVYCAHEYTLSNLRFATAAEPDNAAAVARLEEAEAIREQDLETVPSTLGIEHATNPFLRVNEETVRRVLASRSKQEDDPVERFAALRQWKNEYRG